MKTSERIADEGWRSLRHIYSVASYRRAQRRDAPIPLTTIMNRQGSDKGTIHGYRRGMFVGHAFTEVYEPLFASRRDSPVRLLEVGVGPTEPGVLRASPLTHGRRGGSAAGWREYFSRGDIHAMDILDCSELDSERLTTHIGDQGSRESMSEVLTDIGTPIDIIIDDGSHQSRHQQITLACMFPALADDGIYVIEDLDWQPVEAKGATKTVTLLRQFEQDGTFPSPVLTSEEQVELEKTLVVESIHVGGSRHPGMLAVLRKRR